jgi:hypothetical protein
MWRRHERLSPRCIAIARRPKQLGTSIIAILQQQHQPDRAICERERERELYKRERELYEREGEGTYMRERERSHVRERETAICDSERVI